MIDRKEYYKEYYQKIGKKQKKKRYKNNKTEIIERQKIYVQDNIETVREYQKNYRQLNRDKHLAYMKVYNLRYKDFVEDDEVHLSEYELKLQKIELLSDVIFSKEFKANKIKELKLEYMVE